MYKLVGMQNVTSRKSGQRFVILHSINERAIANTVGNQVESIFLPESYKLPDGLSVGCRFEVFRNRSGYVEEVTLVK